MTCLNITGIHENDQRELLRSGPSQITLPTNQMLLSQITNYCICQLPYLLQGTYFSESSKHFFDWDHIICIYHPLCFLVVFAIRTVNYLYDVCLVFLSIKYHHNINPQFQIPKVMLAFFFPHSLRQCLSNLSMLQEHLKDSIKPKLLRTLSRVFNSVCLYADLRVCVSSKFPVNTNGSTNKDK